MSPVDGWLLALAGVLVLVAALYSAAQAAYGRMSVHRAERLVEEGRRGGPRVLALIQDPVRTHNILALVVLAAQVAVVALVVVVTYRQLGGALAVAAGAGGAFVVLFIATEVVPRTLALQHPERIAALTARWVRLLVTPLSPLAALFIGLGNLTAPGRGLATGPFVTEDDLREMIDVAEEDEVIEESERAMIHSIFELGDTIVREIMVPRPDMVMVSAEQPLREVLDVILRAGHSRIPVYAGDRDTILGLLYAKDVLRRLHLTGVEDGPWDHLIRPASFVPELKRIDELLRELQTAKVHLAVVVDEYGATAGLVTIEDILEEIVGEIVDEYDREEALVEQLDETHWRVDARLPVDELNELLDTELPDEEWDTVGGLLFGLLGHVPDPGEEVQTDSVRLVAELVKGRRISKVLVEQMHPEEPVQ
jgi:CBS domain containing-hemolysin-like protein